MEQVFTFGKNPGVEFKEITEFQSIAFAGGTFLDRIIINGIPYGGGGGVQTKTLVFADGEFIKYVAVRSGDVIDKIRIGTSWERWLECGGKGGDWQPSSWGRLLGISGAVGEFQNNGVKVLSRLRMRIETAA